MICVCRGERVGARMLALAPPPSIIDFHARQTATVAILVSARVRIAFPLGARCGEGTAGNPSLCKSSSTTSYSTDDQDGL